MRSGAFVAETACKLAIAIAFDSDRTTGGFYEIETFNMSVSQNRVRPQFSAIPAALKRAPFLILLNFPTLSREVNTTRRRRAPGLKSSPSFAAL